MIPKSLIRIIALALLPGLLIDPSIASSLTTVSPVQHVQPFESRLQEEAFAPLAVPFILKAFKRSLFSRLTVALRTPDISHVLRGPLQGGSPEDDKKANPLRYALANIIAEQLGRVFQAALMDDWLELPITENAIAEKFEAHKTAYEPDWPAKIADWVGQVTQNSAAGRLRELPFAKRLRLFHKKSRSTPTELAHRSDAHGRSLRAYEKGRVPRKIEAIHNLSIALDVSEAMLLTGMEVDVFGKWLRTLQERLNISTSYMATVLHISEVQLKRVESGNTYPNLTLLIRYAIHRKDLTPVPGALQPEAQLNHQRTEPPLELFRPHFGAPAQPRITQNTIDTVTHALKEAHRKPTHTLVAAHLGVSPGALSHYIHRGHKGMIASVFLFAILFAARPFAVQLAQTSELTHELPIFIDWPSVIVLLLGVALLAAAGIISVSAFPGPKAISQQLNRRRLRLAALVLAAAILLWIFWPAVLFFGTTFIVGAVSAPTSFRRRVLRAA